MRPQGEQAGAAKHECTDVDPIGLAMIVGLLFLLLTVTFLGIWGLMHFMKGRPARGGRPAAATRQVTVFPEPRLEVSPGRELARDIARQRRELDTYGWVDRSQEIARIPIEVAMQLILQRGLPEVGMGQTPLQLIQTHPLSEAQPSDVAPSPAPRP